MKSKTANDDNHTPEKLLYTPEEGWQLSIGARDSKIPTNPRLQFDTEGEDDLRSSPKSTSKTASEELKLKNHLPLNTEANTTISQPGPEDGRDQNIVPDSHSYQPDNGKSKRGINHNAEVHRTDEDDSEKLL